jgi:tRNA(fMet)-specific endonuclease VapC
MPAAILDTDILSEVFKQRNRAVTTHAASYLQAHGEFAFSAFTRFEIERGLKEKLATTLLARFANFCQHSLILHVDHEVLTRAADLWVLARRGGHAHADADLIIAATALEQGSNLVTGNTKHFAWVPHLQLEDWRLP